MKFRLSVAALIFSLAFVTGSARANITYNVVNQVNGAASVTGFLTTDGAFGTIGASDMLSWGLTLNDGVNTFLLNPGNSQVYGGSAWIASATDLSFDFTGSAIALIQNPTIGSSINFWCLDATGGCSGNANSSNWRLNNAVIVNQLSGVQTIATVGAVPEPETYAMMLAGLGLIGFTARRRKQKAA